MSEKTATATAPKAEKKNTGKASKPASKPAKSKASKAKAKSKAKPKAQKSKGKGKAIAAPAKDSTIDATIGLMIQNSRGALDLTQDEFGARYSVSGPAIFKFEKGYVRPSLDLWLRMAADMNVTEKRAVQLWLKSKLPEPYRKHMDVVPNEPSKGLINLSELDGDALRKAIESDKSIPAPLKDALGNADFVASFAPTGIEIDAAIAHMAPLGNGTAEGWREALRLVRSFLNGG